MNKETLRLAIPNIISNITVPLLGMADLALLGRLESEIYIGAVALGGIVFSFIYWSFGFLRMGTTGFTAQAYGRSDKPEIMHTFGRALLVALIGGIALIALQYPVEKISFWLLTGDAEVEAEAIKYFRIRIYAAPATISLYAFTGWFLGMQNAKYPMWLAIVVNVSNLVFNFWFVLGMGLKTEGVALGTVLAQYIGLVLAIVFFLKKYRKYLTFWNKTAMLRLRALRKFVTVNSHIFLRNILIIFVLSFFTNQSANSGNMILAVNTLLLQFFMLYSFVMDGFAYAAESLTGKYVGAGNPVALRKAVAVVFKWGLSLSLPFTLVYFFGGNIMLHILTNNTEIIRAAQPYLPWIALIPVVTFASFLWDGIYVGATASFEMFLTMLIAAILVFLPAFYLAEPLWQNHGLWLAFMLFMGARGIGQTLFARKAVFAKRDN